jgi:hypothetical protein
VRHHHVADHGVELASRKLAERLGASFDVDDVVLSPEDAPNELAHDRVVIDHEHARPLFRESALGGRRHAHRERSTAAVSQRGADELAPWNVHMNRLLINKRANLSPKEKSIYPADQGRQCPA